MATIKNVSGARLILTRVGSLYHRRDGVNLDLADDATGTVPDDFLTDEGAVALIAASDIEVLSYDPTDTVIAGEAATVAAIYSISLDNTPGDVAASNVGAAEVSDADTHDFSNPADRTMTITVNGTAIEHEFLAGDFVAIAAATAEEVDASFDANAALAAEVVITNDGSLVTLTTKRLGTSATLDFAGNAATLLGYAGPVAGTVAPSDVEVLVLDAAGNPAPGVDVDIAIYDAITGGGLLADTQFQAATKGSLDADYTNDAVGTTDANGELDFEIATDISGADNLYLDLGVPTGFFLSITDRKGSDSSRELIAKSS